MSYTQTLYDDFSSSSLDTGKWSTPDGTSGITAGGTNLTLAATTAYPAIKSVTRFDITAGILAVKLSHTGTGNSNSQWYLECLDASGNGAGIEADPTSATWTTDNDGSATVSGLTKVTSTFWSTWTDGN